MTPDAVNGNMDSGDQSEMTDEQLNALMAEIDASDEPIAEQPAAQPPVTPEVPAPASTAPAAKPKRKPRTVAAEAPPAEQPSPEVAEEQSPPAPRASVPSVGSAQASLVSKQTLAEMEAGQKAIARFGK